MYGSLQPCEDAEEAVEDPKPTFHWISCKENFKQKRFKQKELFI